jgi:hypothetical protein
MASRPLVKPFVINVNFERREDGGLRATCDKVPTFFLSHSDPDLVVADVVPALRVILTAMFDAPMDVEALSDIADARNVGSAIPAHLCSPQSYVGLSRVP